MVLSNYLAGYMQLDWRGSPLQSREHLETVLWLVAVRLLTFIPFRLYEGMWRYTSVRDLLNIVAAVAISTSVHYATQRWILGATVYVGSVYVLDSLLLIFFLGGIRLVRRFHRELSRLVPEKRVLIYGAGDAGEMIVRDMRHNDFYRYEPMGFIDDDPVKVGRRIKEREHLGSLAAAIGLGIED